MKKEKPHIAICIAIVALSISLALNSYQDRQNYQKLWNSILETNLNLKELLGEQNQILGNLLEWQKLILGMK